MNSEAKNYELAYLLSPAIPEDEILTHAGKFTSHIEEIAGVIRHVEEPRKRKLAYPIEKEKNAYFGWTTFSSAPDRLSLFEKMLKQKDGILRYLLLEEEVETRPQILRTIPFRPTAGQPRQILRETQKVDEKLDLEALDKKLEEILGK